MAYRGALAVDPETLPLIEVVDFHHRAIDFKWQLRLEFLQLGGVRDDFFNVLANPPVAVYGEAEFLQSFQHLGLLLESRSLGNRVENRLERPLGDERGVELLQRTGGSVTWVLEQRFTRLLAFRV